MLNRNRSSFIKELQEIVSTDKRRWEETAFDRALTIALNALSKDKPIIKDAELQLVCGQRKYPLPADCFEYICSEWGRKPYIEPWDKRYPSHIPRTRTETNSAGKVIVFNKQISAKQFAAYGYCFRYEYALKHFLIDLPASNTNPDLAPCSFYEEDYEIFITRALAALMAELMSSNVTTPIQLHKGMGSMPTNSTPAAAYKLLMTRYGELLC